MKNALHLIFFLLTLLLKTSVGLSFVAQEKNSNVISFYTEVNSSYFESNDDLGDCNYKIGENGAVENDDLLLIKKNESEVGFGKKNSNVSIDELIARLNALDLPNLKLKFQELDAGEKIRFIDDISDLSDNALLQLEDNFGLLDEWKEIDELSLSPQTTKKPLWLQKIHDGNTFNEIRKSHYPNNEVYLVNPSDPTKYVRLDSYIPNQEIVSRKFTQFSEIQESTGIKYIQELKDKYPSGVAKIADVPSNKMGGGNHALQGQINQPINGQMILEIPVQMGNIPQSVLNEANTWGIKIRDVQGNFYN